MGYLGRDIVRFVVVQIKVHAPLHIRFSCVDPVSIVLVVPLRNNLCDKGLSLPILSASVLPRKEGLNHSLHNILEGNI